MLSSQPADPRSIARLEPSWAFVVCWLAVAVLLYLAGSPPGGPAVFPDEVCRLGWARLLSGTGPHYDMSEAAYCQPYYPLLLAPFQWLTHDPAAIHRAVFAINSFAAAACLPLAVRLGIRHFGLGAGSAWIAGIAILAYPSLTLYSDHAMPETMLFPAVLLAFGLWCNWIDRPTWRQFVTLLAMGIALYALHRKMMVVPLALVVGAIAGYWFNRTPQYRMRALLTALALTVAVMLDELAKGVALSMHFQARDAGAIDLVARLFSLEHIQNVAGRAAGIMVYATVVTGGCIWLVLGGGLNSIYRGVRDGFGSLDAFTRKSAFAFGMVALLGALTAAYFKSGERFDLWFYGRHVDSALAAALLPAIAMIARSRVDGPVLRWAIALALLSFLILAAVIPGPPWADFSPFHVIGAGRVMDWMHQAGDRWTLLGYCAAILALAGALYLARMPGPLRFAAVAPFAILATTTHLTTQPYTGVSIESAIPEPAANILREAEPCHIYFDERNGGRLRGHQIFRLQYYFPNCSFELGPSDDPLPPGSLIVVVRRYADCGSGRVCHDLHPDMVLYQTPGE